MNFDISGIKGYLPVLLPIIILEFILMVIALKNVIEHEKFRLGNKAMWIVIVVFIQIVGPILYFMIGKEDN